MADTSYKCGCGETLLEINKRGWKWGHKGKSAVVPAEDQAPTAVPEAESGDEYVECSLRAEQLERIWRALSLREKAMAILTALELPR